MGDRAMDYPEAHDDRGEDGDFETFCKRLDGDSSEDDITTESWNIPPSRVEGLRHSFSGFSNVTTIAPVPPTPNNRLAAMRFAQSLPNGSVEALIAAATKIAAFLDGEG